jgi:hypothetical protein
LVHGVPLVKLIPKQPIPHAPVPDGAIRISVEAADDYMDRDARMAAVIVQQAFVGLGYRDVLYRSARFPSKSFHETVRSAHDTIKDLENSDREARQAGTLQHALRSKPIIIDQLPNLDEFGEPKTTLHYVDGLQAGFATGAHWGRQPKEG